MSSDERVVKTVSVGDRFWFCPLGLDGRKVPMVVLCVYGDGHFVVSVDVDRAAPDDIPVALGYHMAMERASVEIPRHGLVHPHWHAGQPFAFGDLDGEVMCLPLLALINPDLFYSTRTQFEAQVASEEIARMMVSKAAPERPSPRRRKK